MDVLMIHDLRREYFELPLSDYRLTFDDGLHSQYYYYPLLSRHPETLTYFITTGFIRPGAARPMFDGRHLEHLKPAKYAHRIFIEGDFSCCMTTEEVRFLAGRPNVRLGAHSHAHEVVLTDVAPRKPKPPSPWKLARFAHVPEEVRRGLSIRSRLAFQGLEYAGGRLAPRSEADWEDFIRRDTERCLAWFARTVGRTPDVYCFPFNEYSPKLIGILESMGFREFYGARAARQPGITPRTDIDRLLAG
jgi:peptidoglycan/xylan/chitin deacetylase (PgdA/CDA1 family)